MSATIFNENARVRIRNVVKRFEQMSRDNGSVRRPWPYDELGATLKFGKANGIITANTTVGVVHLWELNDAGTTMVDTTDDQEDVNFFWMHGDQDVSNGKEVIIGKFRGEWHVIHAECEDEPAAETPMAATALKTTTPDSPYAAIAGDLVLVDSSGGDFTVSLPTAPVVDNRVGVLKVVGLADNAVIVDTGSPSRPIVPLADVSFSSQTAALQAAFELGIWRWNGTQWHLENNAHTPALVQAYTVTAIVDIGATQVLQWSFVELFSGQTESVLLLETGTATDSRFNVQAALIADVELSFNIEHNLDGNNQNTQFNVTNVYNAASGPGVLLLGNINRPYADPRTIVVQEDADKKGVMSSRAGDTIEFFAEGTGTGNVDLISGTVFFIIG